MMKHENPSLPLFTLASLAPLRPSLTPPPPSPKTLKQTASSQISYREAARRVVAQDGWRGLFLRGLSTRIIANTIQSMIFSVMWKFVEASIA
jgi:hypothetical protein